MSLLRKFQDLNNFIYNENYYNLIFGKTKIGYVHRKIAKYLILNVNGIYLLKQNIYLENTSEIKLKKIILKITETLSKKKNFSFLLMNYFHAETLLTAKNFLN